MRLSLVGGYIEFSEVEDTRDPINLAAPVLHHQEVVSWEHFQPYQHLKESCAVALHVLGTWLDDGSCHVIDDLIVEPESIIKGGKAASFEQ